MKNKMLMTALLAGLLMAHNVQAVPKDGDKYWGGTLVTSGGVHASFGAIFAAQNNFYGYYEIELFGVRDLNNSPATIINTGWKMMPGFGFTLFERLGLEAAVYVANTIQLVNHDVAEESTLGYRTGIVYFAKPNLKLGIYYSSTNGQSKDQPFSKSKIYAYNDVSFGAYYYF